MKTARTRAPRRRALALGLAVALSATAFASHAADECGPAAAAVECVPTTEPYAHIQYENVTDFSLLLKSGLVIDGRNSANPTDALRVWGKGDITVTAEDGVVIHNEDSWSPGVTVYALGGDATVKLDEVYGGDGWGVTVAGNNVKLDANHVEGGLLGIDAGAIDDVYVGAHSVKATNGTAINASSIKGDITVDVGIVESAGFFNSGIMARTYEGDVNVLAGMAMAEGYASRGINAMSDKGNVSIDAWYTYAGGDYAVAILGAALEGDVDILVNDAAYANGVGGTAILGFAGSGDIDINAVAAATHGDWSTGVSAVTYNGNAHVDVESVSSEGGRGINVEATGTVYVGADRVGTSGLEGVGIGVATGGDVIVESGEVRTFGENANAINTSTSGTTFIDVESINVWGAGSEAIFAQGAGDVNVRIGDAQAAASDVDGSAVTLDSFDGDANLQVDRLVRSERGSAINMISDKHRVHVAVAEGASVFGHESAVILGSLEGGRIDVGGALESEVGPVIRALGDGFGVGVGSSDIRVGHTGIVTGFVDLTDGTDVFTNAGTFATHGTNAFDAGTDRFANAGIVALRGGHDAVSFTGLETFDNAGRVSLSNGRTGDSFKTDGAFNGVGGTLAVDVDIVNGKADVIEAGSFAGTSALHLDYVGRGSALGLDGLRVLSSDSAQSGGEIVLADDSVDRGFVGFKLAYDGQDSWLLSSDLNDAAYLAGAVPAGVRDVWRQGTDAVSSHLLATRHHAEGSGVWVQAYGGDFDGTSTLSHARGARELAWRGDHDGILVGAETGFGSWRIGAVGGHGSAKMHLGDDGRTDFDFASAGLYASYDNDGWFATAAVRGERLDLDSRWQAIGLVDEGEGDTLGLSVETGRRFAVGRAWLEPVLRVDWIDSNLPELDGVHGDIAWDTAATTAVEVGLRVGMTEAWHGLRPYAGIAVSQEFAGSDETLYAIGADDVRVGEEGDRTFGRFVGGLSWAIGRFDLHAEASSRSGDMDGLTGRLGVRFKF